MIPKFKVWDNEKKHWLENSECFDILINSKDEVFGYRHHITTSNITYFDEDAHPYKLQNVLICHFTGLCDKNNNPIYEQDILVHDDELKYLVKKDDCSYKPFYGHECWYEMGDCYVKIGSFLENPELLELKNENT